MCFFFFLFRAHFDYDQPSKGEMSFRKGDIFHVTDTLHNNVVGSWQVYRIGKFQFYIEDFHQAGVGATHSGIDSIHEHNSF